MIDLVTISATWELKILFKSFLESHDVRLLLLLSSSLSLLSLLQGFTLARRRECAYDSFVVVSYVGVPDGGRRRCVRVLQRVQVAAGPYRSRVAVLSRHTEGQPVSIRACARAPRTGHMRGRIDFRASVLTETYRA